MRCDSECSVTGLSFYFCTLLNIQAILDVRLDELMVVLETISDMMELLLLFDSGVCLKRLILVEFNRLE